MPRTKTKLKTRQEDWATFNPASYYIEVKAESLADMRAGKPKHIKPLLESQSTKNIAGLKYDIMKKQVEMLCNAGKTKEAALIVKDYEEQNFKGSSTYGAGDAKFKRDSNNGNYPYFGSYFIVGAMRDSMKLLYPELWWNSTKDNKKKPAVTNFRRVVQIRPHHIYFYRDGKVLADVDGVSEQQPVKPATGREVKGFSFHEVIRHPFQFSFTIRVINKAPIFKKLLEKKRVLEGLHTAVFSGLGSGRGVGYGYYQITECTLRELSKA
jgi:hypothetical protein